jgi:hypothetical protein
MGAWTAHTNRPELLFVISLLQVALYAWLWEASGKAALRGPRAFFLLNLLTGETWEVSASFGALTALTSGLLSARLARGEVGTTDSEFIAACAALAAEDCPQLNLCSDILGYFRRST